MGTQEAPLLECRRLSLSAGRRWLVKDLDLAVEPGQFWCVLGPNGVGKTQLLHALAGLRPIDSGEVRVGGWPALARHAGRLAVLRGYVPQQIHDAFGLPVLDVVVQGRHPHLPRWAQEAQEDWALAASALRRVGLEALSDRDVTTLSGGERQRVALATLLVQDPPLALLDEPLAHLDLAQQLRMLQLLAHEVADRRRAVLMSVHDLSLAQRVATHVLLMSPAGAVWAGPAASVLCAERLSEVFGHPICRQEAMGQVWWLPV